MTTYQDIRTAIYNKLKGLADSQSSNLASAYSYSQPATLEPTPAVTLQFEGARTDQFSPVEIEQEATFNARVFVRNDGENAEQTLVGIIDDIVDAFKQDPTLGGIVNRVTVESITGGYEATEQNYRIADLRLTAELVNQC